MKNYYFRVKALLVEKTAPYWAWFLALERRKPKRAALLLTMGWFTLVGTALLLIFLYILSLTLPSLEQLERPQYDLPTQVYDRNGRLVTEFYTKRRVLIPYKQVPPQMIQALLAIEDSRFYYHFGVDPIRIIKALIVDVAHLSFVQGASTLTQQTAKMFLLSTEKKLIRKIKELLLAVQMEMRFTKKEILELYLNKTYFGHGSYGLEAAAQGYFSKSAGDLNLQEVALLAGLPQAPSRWAPTSSKKNALRRRNLVLAAMYKENFITKVEYLEAKSSPIRLKLNKNQDANEASYYTEHIRQYILDQYGMEQLYQGGLQVYTEMDLEQQVAAQMALVAGLDAHDRRQGYRGPMGNLWEEVNLAMDQEFFAEETGLNQARFDALPAEEKQHAEHLYSSKLKELTQANHFTIGGQVTGVVSELSATKALVELGPHQGTIYLRGMEWARPVDYEHPLSWKTKLRDLRKILKVGDVIELSVDDYLPSAQAFSLALYQRPKANGALFSMEPFSGGVRVLSGGYDFRESEFNRATQSRRQPGSSFKPILYSLAFQEGYTRVTPLEDTPLVIKGSDWRPGNFSKGFKGRMPLKEALIHSKNIPTIRLSMSLTPERIIEHARKLGMKAELPDDLTIGLGTASVTLAEMVKTYAIFLNGGKLVYPRYIRKVTTRDGKVLEENLAQEGEQVLDPDVAFLTTITLRDAVLYGTGVRARALGRPVAGKTGTTNNYTDAWFMGMVPQLMTGVYMGFDDNHKTLGELETGSRTALPVWLNYMQSAVANYPIEPFRQPDSIQMVKVVPSTGLLDCEGNPTAYFEYFAAGTAPVACHEQEIDDLPPEAEPSAGEAAYDEEL